MHSKYASSIFYTVYIVYRDTNYSPCVLASVFQYLGKCSTFEKLKNLKTCSPFSSRNFQRVWINAQTLEPCVEHCWRQIMYLKWSHSIVGPLCTVEMGQNNLFHGMYKSTLDERKSDSCCLPKPIENMIFTVVLGLRPTFYLATESPILCILLSLTPDDFTRQWESIHS